MTYNIRKEFLGASTAYRSQGQFNPALDEPTYLTFRLDFFSDEMKTDKSFLYDALPQALFSIGSQSDRFASTVDTIERWDPDLTDVRSFISSFKNSSMFSPDGFRTDRAYSALEYLYSRNEDYRCYLLAKFLKGWNDLQTRYQFYFQEIDGLDDLFRSDPSKGQKIEKSKTITIKCLEGIDQKVKYLLSLYKAAAWDDHYQRWILPDIYRYFKLDILISEIRTFHQSVYADPIGSDGYYSSSMLPNLYSNNGSFAKAIDRFAGKIVDKITGKVFTTLDKWTEGGIHSNVKEDNFVLGAVKGFLPVTCLRCSLCDFDINYNTYQNGYSVNNDQMETTSIKIKVRQAEEIHNWQILEPYRNLLNNTERQFGQDSLRSIVKIGDLADQYFNNVLNLPEDDKSHYYTASIGSGWVVSGIEKIASTVLDENNGVLDKVYDTYEAVRDAIAQKKSEKGNYNGSKATGDTSMREDAKIDSNTIMQGDARVSRAVKDEEDNAFRTGRKEIKPYGSSEAKSAFISIAANDPSTYSYLVALSHQFELDNAFSGIVRTNVGKMIKPKSEDDLSLATDLDSSSYQNSSSFNTYYNGLGKLAEVGQSLDMSRDNTIGLVKIPQDTNKIIELIENGSLTYGDLKKHIETFTKATDANINDMSQPMSSLDTINSLSNIQDKTIEELVNMNNNEDLSQDESRPILLENTNKIEDRSLATDLDLTKNIQNQDFIGIEMLEDESKSFFSLLNTDMISPIDRDYDRSLATDLDGLTINGELVSLLSKLQSSATDYSIDDINKLSQGFSSEDKSVATNLDDDYRWEERVMPILAMANSVSDRSLATNLDNFSDSWEYDALKSMTRNLYNIDRSMATDLDSSFFWAECQYKSITAISELQKSKDRSLATDLDGMSVEELNKIMTTGLLYSQEDRSLATDLDGIPDLSGIRNNRSSIEEAQEVSSSNPLSIDGMRDTMVWAPQDTTSIFDNIASMQEMPQDTPESQKSEIETSVIDNSPSERRMIGESLFDNIASSMSAATSKDSIEIQGGLIDNTSEVKASIDSLTPQDYSDIEVRELIKVMLIDRSIKEREMSEVKLIDNSKESQRKTIL